MMIFSFMVFHEIEKLIFSFMVFHEIEKSRIGGSHLLSVLSLISPYNLKIGLYG